MFGVLGDTRGEANIDGVAQLQASGRAEAHILVLVHNILVWLRELCQRGPRDERLMVAPPQSLDTTPSGMRRKQSTQRSHAGGFYPQFAPLAFVET